MAPTGGPYATYLPLRWMAPPPTSCFGRFGPSESVASSKTRNLCVKKIVEWYRSERNVSISDEDVPLGPVRFSGRGVCGEWSDGFQKQLVSQDGADVHSGKMWPCPCRRFSPRLTSKLRMVKSTRV